MHLGNGNLEEKKSRSNASKPLRRKSVLDKRAESVLSRKTKKGGNEINYKMRHLILRASVFLFFEEENFSYACEIRYF